MEQARFEPPSPSFEPEPEQAEQQGQTQHSLLKRIGATAALGLTVAAIAAVTIKGLKDRDAGDNPVVGGAEIGLPYEPVAELDDSSPTIKEASKTMTSNYFDEGHTTGLLPPTRDTRATLNSYFNNPDVGQTPNTPGLREVAHFQDQELFRPEYEDNLYTYPFSVYNTTGHPLDLVFTNYAIRATKSWLNEHTGADGFIIDGHTPARVQPNGVPHALIMTDVIPPSIRKALPTSDGVTKYYPNLTTSFIKDSGPKRSPFTPWILATEICQSLVDVYDERTLAGQELEQLDMQNIVASFNSAAEADLELAAQESVCNGLGRVVAFSYLGNRDTAEELLSAADEQEGEWIDFGLYQPDISDFLRIRRQTVAGEDPVVSTRGYDSPTASYYRRHENQVLAAQ